MTRQRKQLIVGAAIVIVAVAALVAAGVPVSTLIVVGLAVAMMAMHVGGHGAHGGHGGPSGGAEPSDHNHPRGTDPSHTHDDPARR